MIFPFLKQEIITETKTLVWHRGCTNPINRNKETSISLASPTQTHAHTNDGKKYYLVGINKPNAK